MYGRDPWAPEVKQVFDNLFNISGDDDRERLVAPFITVVQDSDADSIITISFSTVLNANNYRLFINGRVEVQGNQTVFVFTAPSNGQYRISVRAYDLTGEFRSSTNSNIVVINVTSLSSWLHSGLRWITTGLRRILIRE
jgi:hypothetical protein